MMRLILLAGGLLVLAMPAQCGEPKPKPALDTWGDPLPEGVVLRIGPTRLRHAGAITALVFSPDGKLLASGGADGAVRLWNTATGKLEMVSTGDDVTALDFSPDGSTLAASSGYGIIRLWKVANRQQVQRQPGHVSAGATSTRAIRFSPDGKQLSLVDNNGHVFLRDVATGAKQHQFHVQLDHWFRIDLSPDGKRAASAGSDHAVCIWDVASGKQLLKLPRHTDYPYGAAFSHDGRYLASGGRSNKIHLWELATGQVIYTMPSYDHVFTFSPDGRTLASCGRTPVVHLWDMATGKERRTFHHGQRWIEVLAFAWDGRLLATASQDGVIRLWDPVTGQEKLSLGGSEGGTPAAFLDDGEALAVQTNSGFVFYELANPARGASKWSAKEYRRLEGAQGLLSPDGKIVAAGKSYRYVMLWDVARKTERHNLGDQGEISGLAFAPDSQTLALGGWRGIDLVDVEKGKSRRKLEGVKGARALGLAFSPDGKTLAATGGAALRFYNPATGELLREVSVVNDRDYDHQALILGYSPSGKTLAIGGRYRNLQLWDVASANKMLDLKSNGPFAFSPDGRLLATGGPASAVQLWELATGKVLAELRGHDGAVAHLHFSPDGQVLATGSADHTTLLWDIRVGRLFAPEAGALKLDGAGRKSAWEALADADPIGAFHALARLAADPDNSVAYVSDPLQPIKNPEPAQVQKWIADLESNKFETRGQATANLRKLGRLVEPALQKAMEGKPSLEMKRRVERLLADLPQEEVAIGQGEKLRTHRAIHLLEIIGTPAARQVLERLATGPDQAPETRQARAALRRMQAR